MVLRTCIATNEKLPQNELLRIVRIKTSDGFSIAVDSTEKRVFGRSVYLKREIGLLDNVIKARSIERKLKLNRKLYSEEIELLRRNLAEL